MPKRTLVCKQSICKWKVAGLAALVLALYGPQAKADSVILTFEGIGEGQLVGNFYNGGAGGNLGISFGTSAGTSATALVAIDHGGSGLFSGEPSPVSVVVFPGASCCVNVNVRNVPAGFTTFSFFYSSFVNPITVSVWSGLDATGSMLGSVTLNPNINACVTGNKFAPPFLFCNWTQEEIVFTGTAESVDFSDVAATGAAFDNMALTTPEPSTLLLLAVGSLGLAGLRHKKPA